MGEQIPWNEDRNTQNLCKELFYSKEGPKWLKRYKAPRTQLDNRKKTIRALLGDPMDHECIARAERMHNCAVSRPCMEIYCPFCRQMVQKTERERLMAQFGHRPKGELYFLTLLICACYDPVRHFPEQKDKAAKDLHNALRKFPGIRVYGIYEIDAKDPLRIERQGKNTKKAMHSLGMRTFQETQNQYLLHLHAIVDLAGHEWNRVVKGLREKFPGPFRVDLLRVYRSKTKEENIETLAYYMSKHRLQYADNIHANQWERKTRYGQFYPEEVVRTVVKASSEITRTTSSGRSNGVKHRSLARFKHGI